MTDFLGTPPRNGEATRAEVIERAVNGLCGSGKGCHRGAIRDNPEALTTAECAAIRDVCAANMAGVIVEPWDLPMAQELAAAGVVRAYQVGGAA
jgi:hypothetical protein